MAKSGWIFTLVLAIFLIAIPSLPFGEKDILTLLISLFTIASMASSWNILAGYVGRINLGHVAFYGLGALVTRQLWLVYEWELALAFIAGGLVAALAAVIVGVPALRLKGIYFSVGTLAMAEALRLTVSNVLPKVSRLPGPMLREYDIVPRYYLALAVLIVIVITVAWLNRSKIGLGMMAIREDEEAARSIGVNVLSHSMFAFILSAFFAGLAGGTFAFFHVSYYPSLTFIPVWTFDALLVTFIGGIGTLRGPLIGATFFVLVRDILSSNLIINIPVQWLTDLGVKVFGEVSVLEFRVSDYHLVIFGMIFIFVVLALPGGIEDLFAKVASRFKRFSGVNSDKRINERTSYEQN